MPRQRCRRECRSRATHTESRMKRRRQQKKFWTEEQRRCGNKEIELNIYNLLWKLHVFLRLLEAGDAYVQLVLGMLKNTTHIFTLILPCMSLLHTEPCRNDTAHRPDRAPAPHCVLQCNACVPTSRPYG